MVAAANRGYIEPVLFKLFRGHDAAGFDHHPPDLRAPID
jgi:hypothetical protein